MRSPLAYTRVMPMLLLLTLSLFALALGGCASTNAETGAGQPLSGDPSSTTSAYGDFDDVLVPTDLDRNADETFFYESEQFRMGFAVFEGRVDPASLTDFFIANMTKDGWVSKTTFKSSRSELAFEKPNKSALIRVSDESMFTTSVKILVVEYKPGMVHGNSEAPMSSGTTMSYPLNERPLK